MKNKKHTSTYTIIFLLLLTNAIFAAIPVGDIAVIGWNSDSSNSTKDFAIVTLEQISSGETIFFTDKGISGGNWQNDLATEGIFSWVTNTVVPAGTIIKFTVKAGATPVVSSMPNTGICTVTNGWTSASVATPFGNNGDQILIYQGTLTNPVFIFAFNGTSNSTGLTNGWNLGGSPANNYSEIPNGLTNTVNAVSLASATAVDNYAYTGIKTGTKATLLNEICNASNWTGNDTVPFDLSPGSATFPGNNPIFLINSLNTSDNNFANKIVVFPNPFTTYIQIDSPENLIIQTINLFSIDGRKMGSYSENKIETAALSKGTYILEIINNENNSSKIKVIKQ